MFSLVENVLIVATRVFLQCNSFEKVILRTSENKNFGKLYFIFESVLDEQLKVFEGQI